MSSSSARFILVAGRPLVKNINGDFLLAFVCFNTSDAKRQLCFSCCYGSYTAPSRHVVSARVKFFLQFSSSLSVMTFM